MYYNQAILWQGQGKTMQMLDNFYNIFSSLIPLFCSYIAGSKIIQQGGIKYKAWSRYDVQYEPGQINNYICSESKYIIFC